MRRLFAPVLAACVLSPAALFAQQVVDTAFAPHRPTSAAHAPGRGPLVLIDEAHNNFHTRTGRFAPFARLLESDGFVVGENRAPFTRIELERARVVVIANALHASVRQTSDWRLPGRSALDSTEIRELAAWVRSGGSLLLIADHMPFAGAAAELAAEFGVLFANGFVEPPNGAERCTRDFLITYRRGDGSLRPGAITTSAQRGARVDSVTTFTGSAFRFAPGVVGDALLQIPRGKLWLPRVAWTFGDTVPSTAADGMLQGAVLRVGRGRVAVFAEAAMFTAQRKCPERLPMGFNAPVAGQNAQFVLNVVRWLGRPTTRPREAPR
ncbi:MAG TPA: hypothetical protein VFZ21_03345 [Gemmatimonadaceae bacterium]|nr:hypothetical protein [Gemmatimonadaceae bacterium]